MQFAPRLLLLASLAVLVLSMAVVVLPVFGATAPEYAAYNVTGSAGGHSFSAVINETVAPSSTSGMSDVTLQIASNMANLSYSKIMNSSQVILPYFPTISNQSLTYQLSNYSMSATIHQAGSGSATYAGKTYAISNYTFSVSVSGKSQMSASGSTSVFPSGLVYSARIVANGTDTIIVQLLGTNLSLDAQSNSSMTTSIAVAGGAGTILAGIGAFVFYKRKGKTPSENTSDAKPLYHVD
jgi:hypothetical protein